MFYKLVGGLVSRHCGVSIEMVIPGNPTVVYRFPVEAELNYKTFNSAQCTTKVSCVWLISALLVSTLSKIIFNKNKSSCFKSSSCSHIDERAQQWWIIFLRIWFYILQLNNIFRLKPTLIAKVFSKNRVYWKSRDIFDFLCFSFRVSVCFSFFSEWIWISQNKQNCKCWKL